jgi:hypothetical protein
MAVVRARELPLSPVATAFVDVMTHPASARPELPEQAYWMDPDV